MTDDSALPPIEHEPDALEERIDADLALVSAYLAGELRGPQALALEERLATDRALRQNVQPLIDAWAMSIPSLDGGRAPAVAPLSPLEIAEGWRRYREDPLDGAAGTTTHVDITTRRRSMIRIAAVTALIVVPIVAFSQLVLYSANNVGAPGHALAQAIVPIAWRGSDAKESRVPTLTAVAQVGLPDRLSDAEFWKLVTDMSEVLGRKFAWGDNYISNEGNIGAIAGVIRQRGPHGGVYVGVGPEQNLTYIAAVRPQMAFIIDIRRQAVMQHLLYKAIFELSRDRADFISLLFAIPRPSGLSATAGIKDIWTAFVAGTPDPAFASANLARFTALLTKTHGFTFTGEEQAMFDHVYGGFAWWGASMTGRSPAQRGVGIDGIFPPGRTGDATDPGGTRNAPLTGRGGWAVTPPPPMSAPDTARRIPGTPGFVNQPNFINLTIVTDAAGQFDSFLASDDAFQFLKQLNAKNLYVPVSGDFAGPTALRAIGAYVKARGAIVSAFYVSSVEVFLFEDHVAGKFYDNLSTLPANETSVIIRPTARMVPLVGNPIYGADPTGAIGASLCPMATFVRAVASHGITPGGRGAAGSSFPKVMECRP